MPRFRSVKRGPTEDTIERRFAPALADADETRRAIFDAAALLEKTRASMAERERSGLAVKAGAEAGEADAAAAAAAGQTRLAAFAAANAQRQRITPPSVPEKGLVVHGRAVDDTRVGVPGLTAGLLDVRGKVAAR